MAAKVGNPLCKELQRLVPRKLKQIPSPSLHFDLEDGGEEMRCSCMRTKNGNVNYKCDRMEKD